MMTVAAETPAAEEHTDASSDSISESCSGSGCDSHCDCVKGSKHGLVPGSDLDQAAYAPDVHFASSKKWSSVHKVFSTAVLIYILYSLFGMVAWVSHLGARVPMLQPILVGKGYASNEPVPNIAQLFIRNGLTAILFVLPHSLLRPPQLTRLVGVRYARLLYCLQSAITCHMLIYFWRPIDMTGEYDPTQGLYVYDESKNKPIFTLPVPKMLHNALSVGMLAYTLYCILVDDRTFVILGYNRAYYGLGSGKDIFPAGLSPRMDIITWMGYCTWLKAGSLGFILFSGLSILPYKVYTWDIVLRVVAATYLRLRSQGFRIWVGQIESTHHLIWVLRGAIVAVALYWQYTMVTKEGESGGSRVLNADMFSFRNIALLGIFMIGLAVFLDRLEKLK